MNAFRDMEPGSVCTGTIRYFGLPVRKLLERRIISVQSRKGHDEYVFLGLEPPLKEENPEWMDANTST